MAYERKERLKYNRKLVNFRLPDFIIAKLDDEANKTKAAEEALMKHYGLEYPKDGRN